MAVFRRPEHVTEFEGTLVKLRGRRVTKVAVLLAKRGRHPSAFGIIPAEPLERKSSYRAEFTWRENDQPRQRWIRFRTR